MSKKKISVTRNSEELAKLLGLSLADGIEMEVKEQLNSKIIEIVKRKSLTHLEVAKLSGTSRTRITAIMNRNTKEISTDLLFRVVGALGYKSQVKFSKAA